MQEIKSGSKQLRGESVDEKKIENIITNDVFEFFAQNQFQKGQTLLKKIYLSKYNQIEDLELKRKILHNLAWVEFKLNNIGSAKTYILTIRKEVETDLQYIYTHKLEYGKLLNLYAEIFKNEIGQEEYIEIQIFNAGTYEQISAVGRYALAMSNVYLVKREYSEIVNLIREVYVQEDEQEKYCIEEILSDLKKYSLEHYKEALAITKITKIHGKGVR
jgi:hypothetical protein